jgi:hypothetical protein
MVQTPFLVALESLEELAKRNLRPRNARERDQDWLPNAEEILTEDTYYRGPHLWQL